MGNTRVPAKGKKPIKAVIIGGGRAGQAILELVASKRLTVFDLEILAVVDLDLKAPGAQYADEHWWPTLDSMEEALQLPGLELVVELTGDPQMVSKLYQLVPEGVEVMSHNIARIFWEVFEYDRALVKEYLQRRKLQKQMDHERRELQNILNAIPDVIMVVDTNLSITWANQRFADVTGVPLSEAKGRTCHSTFCGKLAQEDFGPHACPCRRAIKTRQTVKVETQRKISDDNVRTYQITASPIFDEHGKLTHVVEVSREVTAFKQLVQLSDQQQRLFQELIEAASDFVSIKDNKGHYMVMNPAFAAFFGKEPRDFMGRRDEEVLPGEVADTLEQNDAQVRETKSHLCQTERLVLDDKEHILLSTRFPLWNHEHQMNGLCQISRDVTEERKLHEELVKAERLAAVGNAVGGLAHDIKNILNGFEGGQYVLDFGLDVEDMDEIRKGKRMIERNIQRVSAMIRNMLAYSKDRTPVMEAHAPDALLQELAEQMRPTVEEHGIEFACDTEDSPRSIHMDNMMVYRVLMNLLSNAVDACNEKSYDSDEEEGGEEENPRIEIKGRFVDESKTYVITLTDNGIGMTDAVKKRIFQGFFSTKGSRGTGFGMPVSVKLLQEMGGSLSLDSKYGKGTTFTVTLPAGG